MVECSSLYLNNLYDKIMRFLDTEIDPADPTDSQYHTDEFGETCASIIVQQQKKLTDSEILEIISKYNSGVSTYNLAMEYGCHRTTISHTLKSCGISVDKSWAQRKIDANEVIRLYKDGATRIIIYTI